jgi:uncharacterized protein (TIGR00255 family)
MTGFGRAENHNENYQATVEIKSVNNRYKDFRFKMPSLFNFMEMDLKKILLNEFKRGSFEIFIGFKALEEKSKLASLDLEKVNAFVELFNNKVDSDKASLQLSPVDFLRDEFLIERDFASDPELIDIVQQSFRNAVNEFKESRSIEGEKLVAVIKDYKTKYENYVAVVHEQKDQVKEALEEKLKQRFSEYSKELKIDEPRYLQEVIYYLEKLDISEELDRISVHLSKLDSLVNGGGEVGRQLDFLIQELNRETNTIGSKSNNQNVSESVVQMKVCLEKIREQTLNLE